MNEKKDQIGIDDIVERLAYRVDAVSAEENVCVSLNGEWGSGKTFILEKFESKLREGINQDKYLVVKYDAWKNNFYSDPLIAILFCIFDELEGQVQHRETKRAQRNQKKQAKKYAKEVIKEISNNTAELAKTLCDKISKLNGWASIVAVTAEIIKSIIKQATYKTLDHEKFDDFKSYQSLLNEAKATLNALTNQSNQHHKKLVILVDEIDRCLPNEQMLILERLHHLFDIKNCAVIVALNEAAVVNGYNKQFTENVTEQFSDGNMYLRKFFDYEVKVPIKGDAYLHNTLREIIAEQNKDTDEKNKLSTNEIELIIDFVNELREKHSRAGQLSINKLSSIRQLESYINDLKKVFVQCKFSQKNFVWMWFAAVGLYAKKNIYNYRTYNNGAYVYTQLLQLNTIFKDTFSINKIEVKYIREYYDHIEENRGKKQYYVYNNIALNILQYSINYYLITKCYKDIKNANLIIQVLNMVGDHYNLTMQNDVDYNRLNDLVKLIEQIG